MKLTLHSFDFEEETLTFRVPKNVLLSNSFGAIPEGVEVDLAPVTGNTALGIKVLPTTDTQQLKDEIADMANQLEVCYHNNLFMLLPEYVNKLRQLSAV